MSSYVGNISFFKGVDRLLDVAKHLMDTNLKIKIYGETRGELKFEKLLKENINKLKLNNIKLMGRTKKAEKIIQNAFVVLRPSRWNDPWGRDVLDAFNAGVPCISTGNYDDIIINKKMGFM